MTAKQAPLRRLALLLGALCLAAATSAGCTSATDLAVSPHAQIIGKNTQRASEAGVVLTAEVDRWDDHPQILRQLTPIWVTITNHSGQPIDLRYRHFRIATPGGVEMVALPPYGIDGQVAVRVDDPSVYRRDYAVYQPVSSTYPSMPVTRYGGLYDGGFYDYNGLYDDFWIDVPLPTPHMVERALPEGVVANGGSVTGYLYFPEIDDDLPSIDPYKVRGSATVHLEVDLVDAESGTSLGTLTMPFLVD